MRPDQERVTGLIVSTVIKLCEKGLDYSNSVTIQGVIGVTVDNTNTFVIHINKTVSTNECGFDNYPLSTSKVSPIDNVQEPSSSSHRDGAISVSSTGSTYSTNLAGGSQQSLLVTNIKVENNHHTSYNEDVMHQNVNPCKMETTDASYDQDTNFNYNDEDTLDFKDTLSEIKAEEFHDVRPNIFPGNISGIIDVPSDVEDANCNDFPQQSNVPKQQNINSHQQMIFQQQQHCQQQQQQRQKLLNTPQRQHRNPSGQFRMSPPTNQNSLRPALNASQMQPQVRGQFAPWGANAATNSPPRSMNNKLSLVPAQPARPRQLSQTRQRAPNQPIRTPRGQPRHVNPSNRMSPSNVTGRGANAGWRDGKATNQEIECQSGDGFSFNKQLTVLSRYSCNLCGKVYKNQRSVLHHQSQVHGRPKVSRRKKTDVYEQEGGYDEEEYEEDYGEEAW